MDVWNSNNAQWVALNSVVTQTQSSGYDCDGITIAAVAEKVGFKWGAITGSIEDQLDLIQTLEVLKETIEKEIIEQGGTVFVYKGQVATYEDLPTDAEPGDVYDVEDTGANYVWNGHSWDKLSEIIDLSGFVKTTDFEEYKENVAQLITLLKEDLEEKINSVDTKVAQLDETLQEVQGNVQGLETLVTEFKQATIEALDEKLDIATHEQYVEQVNADLQVVNLKMDDLEKKVVDVKSLDPEIVVLYDGGDTEFTNKEKDFILSGAITAATSIAGNNIQLNDVTVMAACANMIAAQDVTVKSLTLTGVVPLKISSGLIKVHADGYVSISDCTLNPETCYNGIEIGKNAGLAKSIVIDNVDFAGHFANNAIQIFGMANNGVITISNCHFADVFNVLKICNRVNYTTIVNMVNCTIDKWTDAPYAGLIAFEDVTSKSKEEANENNLFGNGKVIVNIQNITGPNGKIVRPDNIASICGTQDNNQIFYIWDEYRDFTAYDAQKYPIINII